jgi:hypothetical protein
MVYYIRMLPQARLPHDLPWCLTASKNLELGAALLKKELDGIHAYPPTASLLTNLLQNEVI